MNDTDTSRSASPTSKLQASGLWVCRTCSASQGLTYRYPPSPWVYCSRCGGALDLREQEVALQHVLHGRPACKPEPRETEPPVTKDLLTVAEVADLLGRSKKAVYALAARGNLPGAIKVGRGLLVRRSDLLRSSTEGRVPSRRMRR